MRTLPSLDKIRSLFGYRFPRLGSMAMESTFKAIPRHLRVELFRNIYVNMDLSDLVQRSTYWQGSRFEYPTAAILNEWGNNGAERFFDIGSNYGFFSYFIRTKFPDISIDSFEPNPTVYEGLSQSILSNQLAKMKVHHLGISNEEATLSLTLGGADSGHSTFGTHPGLIASDSVKVNVVPFDLWLKRNGIETPHAPTWIAKIDVEGFEMNVLEGMPDSLSAKAFKGLVIEANDFTSKICGRSIQDIHSFMKTFDYYSLAETHPGLWPYQKSANLFFTPRIP